MKKILILDDEKVLCAAFAAYFEDRLWEPIQAGSAEEALKLLETETPDAALVDLRLPDMNGDDFVRQACLIKPKLAFIICTGSPDYVIPSDLQERAQVCSQPLRKPIARLAELEGAFMQIIAQIPGNSNEV
jgi:DNA-binding NtrC family response regulator